MHFDRCDSGPTPRQNAVNNKAVRTELTGRLH